MNFTIEAALAHHREGRLSEAERLYRSVLIEDPDQFDALHLLGIIKLQQRNSPEAVTFLTRAVTNRPQSIDALCNLSAALLDLKRYDEAVSACDRALTADPLSTEALFNRAAALSEL